MKLIRLIIERIKYENEEWPEHIRRYRQRNIREGKSGDGRGSGKSEPDRGRIPWKLELYNRFKEKKQMGYYYLTNP